ncbi:MAG: hypothetical protein QS748_13040 [Candidatus Endonucleobacter bathymodioli]|uniref:RING-type domain-containing protein n=1 Tax=Candidatus Endonucleibacter bathymodioli TaxID=539814 RepID=A0AA90SYT8_9GAMM|nr:hypothetical protein [Candidatus Endonucleobacter bathymodioli]
MIFAAGRAEYKSYLFRIKSYKSVDRAYILTNISHAQCAQAGFFSLGTGAWMECFCCNKKINAPIDMPLYGAMKYPYHDHDCSYIKDIKLRDLLIVNDVSLDDLYSISIKDIKFFGIPAAKEAPPLAKDAIPMPFARIGASVNKKMKTPSNPDDIFISDTSSRPVTLVQDGISESEICNPFSAAEGTVYPDSLQVTDKEKIEVSAIGMDSTQILVPQTEDLVSENSDDDISSHERKSATSGMPVSLLEDSICALEECSLDNAEGGNVYKNALHRLYMVKSGINPEQQAIWKSFHNQLKSRDLYKLGLSFNMFDGGPSFPTVIRSITEPEFKYSCSFSDARAINKSFFNGDSFLTLSLMLEMNRKLVMEAYQLGTTSYILLLRSFGDVHLSYKSSPLRASGIDKSLGSLIGRDGKFIGGNDVFDTDIGVVLLLAPRYLLLKKPDCTAAEISDFIYNLSKMFCEKVIVNNIYTYLNDTQNTNDFKYNEDGCQDSDLSRILLIPSIKEMAFLESQHLCAMYLWSLLNTMNIRGSVPGFVDPNQIAGYVSIGNMQNMIKESGESVFKDKDDLDRRLIALSKKIKSTRMCGPEVCITDDIFDACKQQFIKNISDCYLFRKSDKLSYQECFTVLYPHGSLSVKADANSGEVDKNPACYICYKGLEVGKTEMVGFADCNHYLDKKCWQDCKDAGVVRCALCRRDFTKPLEYIYGADGVSVQSNNETINVAVDESAL